MKVVVDTNVLVSAALRNREPNAVIRFIIVDPNTEWVASMEILEEYREVLSRPKLKVSPDDLEAWMRVLDEHVVLVPVTLEIDLPRDRKDSKFLSCAASAAAQVFVTGDRDFADAQRLLRTLIMSVAKFKQVVCDGVEDGGLPTA
jgi:putative PIN family toxin of toxin-antitoxin system